MHRNNQIAYQMGDAGVDVKLNQRARHYPSSTEGGRVYWAAIEYNIPAYVIADPILSLEGLTYSNQRSRFYHAESNTYVRLISVNGIGEIRWTVDPLMLRSDVESYGHAEHAAIFFGLIDSPETTARFERS